MKSLCPFCEEYARKGNNYCRMCGFRVAAEEGRQSAIPMEYEPPERYCGHCGMYLSECSGTHDQ